MTRSEMFFSLILATLIGVMIGSFEQEEQHKSDLLRFCMTRSIPLEQCKIPEEGE